MYLSWFLPPISRQRKGQKPPYIRRSGRRSLLGRALARRSRRHWSHRGGRRSYKSCPELPTGGTVCVCKGALILLKATQIKIGWVSCRVRRKTELIRCYRCLVFSHMAANCRGPDRSRFWWRAARRDTPRRPAQGNRGATMRCPAFREAAPHWRP